MNFLVLLMILTLVAFSGCRRAEEKPQPQDNSEEIPKQLITLASKTDSVFKDVEEIEAEIEKPEMPEQQEQGNQQEQQQEQGNQEEQGGEESQEAMSNNVQNDNSKEEEKPKEQKLIEMWQAMESDVREIHSQWNNYEPKAINKGANSDDIDKFERALNHLTIAIEERNKIQILNKSNEMTLYLSSFFDLYKGNPNGDIMRMRYHIRQTYLHGMVNDWSKAEESILKTDDILNRLRHQMDLEKEDQEKMEKFNLSLQDIKKSLREMNPELVKIKRDIALENLEEIEEAAK